MQIAQTRSARSHKPFKGLLLCWLQLEYMRKFSDLPQSGDVRVSGAISRRFPSSASLPPAVSSSRFNQTRNARLVSVIPVSGIPRVQGAASIMMVTANILAAGSSGWIPTVHLIQHLDRLHVQ
jgi:hypothetical protein